MTGLLIELAMARADGSYPKLLDSPAKTPLPILDGWLRDPLSAVQSRALLEVLDDRYKTPSLLVAPQVPSMPGTDDSDALLDRLVHST